MAFDTTVKPYSFIADVLDTFKPLQQGEVISSRDQLDAIRSTLEQIEGELSDVIDI